MLSVTYTTIAYTCSRTCRTPASTTSHHTTCQLSYNMLYMYICYCDITYISRVGVYTYAENRKTPLQENVLRWKSRKLTAKNIPMTLKKSNLQHVSKISDCSAAVYGWVTVSAYLFARTMTYLRWARLKLKFNFNVRWCVTTFTASSLTHLTILIFYFSKISKYKISARMTVPPLKKQSAASVRTHEDLMTDWPRSLPLTTTRRRSTQEPFNGAVKP